MSKDNIDNILANYLEVAIPIPKSSKDQSKKEQDCIQKLNKVIRKFELNKNKKISDQKLNRLERESQEMCELVLSNYESEETIPNAVMKLILKVENCNYFYMKQKNERELKKLNSTINTLDIKIGKTIKEMDNIWGNVISVILSFSMVAAFIEGISKIDKELVPLFGVSVIWIGMTLLVFFSNLFDNKKLGNNTSKVMYYIVTVLTIVVAICTIVYLSTDNTTNSNISNKSNVDSNIEVEPVIENYPSEE